MNKSKFLVGGLTLVEILIALTVLVLAEMMVLPTFVEKMRKGNDSAVILGWFFAVLMVLVTGFVLVMEQSRGNLRAWRILILSICFAVSSRIAWLGLTTLSIFIGSTVFCVGLISPFYRRQQDRPLWHEAIEFCLLVVFVETLLWAGLPGVLSVDARLIPAIFAVQVMIVGGVLRWWDACKRVDLPYRDELFPYPTRQPEREIYDDSQ